ncbi:AI-2E family transporter [Fructobacillus tropaeoli]|uniref:AI-2E family transporter n=1 Tax=Fructobacillus tropaeoli TaxID=709323 RepID=UPI001940A3D4|nr:AI-2E family transporter [Fructobacillus tropaeoli]GIC69650.1 AI-2E family transporter [Fructobacillus tropaeoli]CAK1225024.1 Predicted PurR-regulated permease PerM (PerM) [Fructobacillus tropaeoli]CAK1234742.1 Predicted PurR-regulated permease PerM (PerM) [Fructobacillus tropaeoli]
MPRENGKKSTGLTSVKGLKTLTAVVLVLLIIWLAYQVRFIFGPIESFVAAVGAPILIAGVFYYLLNPLVTKLETKLGWKRNRIVLVVLVLFILILVAAIAFLARVVTVQVTDLLTHWPSYLREGQDWIKETFEGKQYDQLRNILVTSNDQINHTAIAWVQSHLGASISGVGHFAARLSEVGVVLVSTPFILYYLLVDGAHLPEFIIDKLPPKARPSTKNLLAELSGQISKYIRGQLGVALSVTIMFAIGYTIIGLPSGILLAILAGVLNLIPYLGSFLAQVPVFAVAFVTGGVKMAVLAAIVLVIEQPLEGHVITPKILGDALDIHPVTVIVVLLASGQIFGLLGFILAVPGYAVLKVLVVHLYTWWRTNSKLFKEELDKELGETK